MSYKYITKNNLFEKQNYMYSEYKGNSFLQEYLNTRNEYLASWGTEDSHTDICFELDNCGTMRDRLKRCIGTLRNSGGGYDKETVIFVNKCVQSFEVRKRIYMEYDDKWKPLGGSTFEDYEIYLLFAECLLCMYSNTRCMKYFSCLLKLDDTLLSIWNDMDIHYRKWLGYVIMRELDIFHQLMNEVGIKEEGK